MSKFPGATHTFTVRRNVGLVADPANPQNLINGGKAAIHTGVSVQVKPLIGLQVASDAGLETEAKFIGLTYSGTDIHDNDDLLDETANNNAGTPVGYSVSAMFDNGYYLQLFLRQKSIGG